MSDLDELQREAAEELRRIGASFSVDMHRRVVLARQRATAAAYANSVGVGYGRIAEILGCSKSFARKLCAQGAQYVED